MFVNHPRLLTPGQSDAAAVELSKINFVIRNFLNIQRRPLLLTTRNWQACPQSKSKSPTADGQYTIHIAIRKCVGQGDMH